MEIWQDIQGYEGLYQVSNLGRVKSMERMVERKYNKTGFQKIPEKILKPVFKVGYKAVGLYKKSVLEQIFIHRLVANAFIPNPENKPQVNHIGKNGNGGIDILDNKVESLEWVTAKENIQHAWKNGMCENVREATINRTILSNSRKVINVVTLRIYNSAKEAAISIGIDSDRLSIMLRGDTHNLTDFKYIDNDIKKTYGKIVLNIQTGIFYNSAKEAALAHCINRNTLRAMLNGQNHNKTNLIYV